MADCPWKNSGREVVFHLDQNNLFIANIILIKHSNLLNTMIRCSN